MKKANKEFINKIIDENENSINEIDENLRHDSLGIAQAIDQLKQALEKVEDAINNRDFEHASALGYHEVSSEFVFLQRCLGRLNDTACKKSSLAQNITMEVAQHTSDTRMSYEHISPMIDEKISFVTPHTPPKRIENSIGSNTFKKLKKLGEIQNKPIEAIAEMILASAMKNDYKKWKACEESKSPVDTILEESKRSYSPEDVQKHLKTLSQQQEKRKTSLY